MPNEFAKTPTPPYYAVIFSARLTQNQKGYAAMAEKMMRLALAEKGCLGAETARDALGFGITVSYWRDTRSIADWKSHLEHLMAQQLGKTRWYEHYELRIACVERAYSGPEGR
jgi:heme-degrading monooxygenase HmoA